MTKLKSAEYWEDVFHEEDMITLEEVIKKAQQNAIEVSLEMVAEKTPSVNHSSFVKSQIKSLINHKDLKV